MKRLFNFFLTIVPLIAWGQIVDVPPINRENYKVYQGGSRKAQIDSRASLKSLIERLNSNWQLEETYKGYWIGYNDDMYSIAAHKDAAIKPLLDFIKQTQDIHSKLAAVYCLHLIGIDSKIVGRYNEEFVNTKARHALLGLIFQAELTDKVISLLARDPWKADLPILSFYLKYYPANLTLLNALFRYEREKMPFRQTVNENIDNIPVFIRDSSGVHRIGTMTTVYRAKRNDFSPNGMQDIIVQFGDSSRVARKFNPSPWNYTLVERYFKCNHGGNCEKANDYLYDFLLLSWEKVSGSSYFYFGDELHHYVVEGRILVICTVDQTLKIWRQFYKKERL